MLVLTHNLLLHTSSFFNMSACFVFGFPKLLHVTCKRLIIHEVKSCMNSIYRLN